MTRVDFNLFLKLWVWSIQASPNSVKSFTNSWVLSPNYPNVYRQAIQDIFNLRNIFFSLILNLSLDSSPCFTRKKWSVLMKTFSNLVFWRWFCFWWNKMIVVKPPLCFKNNMASNSVLKSKRKTVEEPAKEQGIWIFVDIECRVDKKVIFPWNLLFQEF